MILEKYPQIRNLLVADKPYTIIIALAVIALAMVVCYYSKVIHHIYRI